MERYLGKLAGIVGVVIVAVIAGLVVLIVVAVMAINWLLNQGGDEIKQTGQAVVEQVTPDVTVPALNLESYVVNGAVTAEKLVQLEQTFTSLPSQLQDAWLQQFETQLTELRQQAGISDETINALTSLQNSFRALTGE